MEVVLATTFVPLNWTLSAFEVFGDANRRSERREIQQESNMRREFLVGEGARGEEFQQNPTRLIQAAQVAESSSGCAAPPRGLRPDGVSIAVVSVVGGFHTLDRVARINPVCRSVGSIASIGSIGSICSALAVASAGSAASIMSFRSSFSLLSSRAQAKVIGRRPIGRQDRMMLLGTIAIAAVPHTARAKVAQREGV
jgi:hypothetical protein